jgi:two-component system OmpR family sensor kinase
VRTLTFSLVFVVFIATVGLGWLFDRLYEQNVTPEQQQNTDAVQVLEQFGSGLAQAINGMPERNQLIQNWQLIENKQLLKNEQQVQPYQLSLVSFVNFPLPNELHVDLKQGKPLLLESDNGLTFHFYLPVHDELLLVKSPLLLNEIQGQSTAYIFTTLFYFALVLLFLLWSYPLVRQLLALRQAAKSFGEGKLTQRISPSSISYIKDIESEFNHMAQRIENLIADVKLLSTAVSHDLRTPLARIRFGIDTLQEEDDVDQQARFIEKISGNVDQMTDLVETLLSYARLDRSMLEVKKDKVCLSSLVANCIKLNIKLKENNNLSFNVLMAKEELFVIGDKRYLTMLINNLLQNAINYGQGKIVINLTIEEGSALFTVADNGQGILEHQRLDMFKPFVRGKHESQKLKGHGIGLAIVKRIVDWHHGTIYIEQDEELLGAKFVVSLPLFH